MQAIKSVYGSFELGPLSAVHLRLERCWGAVFLLNASSVRVSHSEGIGLSKEKIHPFLVMFSVLKVLLLS